MSEHMPDLRKVDAILFLDVRALLWTSCKRLLAWRRYLQVRGEGCAGCARLFIPGCVMATRVCIANVCVTRASVPLV